MDDSVDPAVAVAGTAGSMAAEQQTVVRDQVDTSKDSGTGEASGSDAKPRSSSVFDGSKEPVTASRTSPVRASAKSSASGVTPPPASAASVAASPRPASPRFVPADSAKSAKSASKESVEAPADPNASVEGVLPLPKSGKSGADADLPAGHDDSSGRPISPSGTAAPPPAVNVPDLGPSSAATLAAAALAGDSAASGYTPASYSDYSPAGYTSSRDSVWPSTPSSSRDTRQAAAGFPPAEADSSRTSAGYVPADPAPAASAWPSASGRSSASWTSQEPTSGKIGYSPSGSQRPETGHAAASAAGAAVGAAAAGIAAGAQFPGRMVAGKAPSRSASSAEDLVSKLKAPFSTATKKRKPSEVPGQADSARTSMASTVRSKPTAANRPVAAAADRFSRQPGSESHRDAQLVLSRIEPWSVMKFSFIISLVGWIVLFVAVALLYYALRSFGVFQYLEQTVSTVTSSKGSAGSNAAAWFSASTVLGFTMLVGAINVVMFTALATVGAVIYNLVTRIAGGVEVTLREAD